MPRRARVDRLLLLLAPFVLGLLAGCAPRTVTIRLEPATSRLAAPASPTRDRTVYVRAVKDARTFTPDAKEPSAPSLATTTEMTPGKTATAVAQIHNAFGTVIADVFLEDGKTVPGLVKTAVADAYARAGYRVVDSASAPTDIGIDVDVLDFWAYNFTTSMIFRFTALIRTRLTADAPGLAPDQPVSSTLSLHSHVAATPRAFQNTLTKALEQYVQELSLQLNTKP